MARQNRSSSQNGSLRSLKDLNFRNPASRLNEQTKRRITLISLLTLGVLCFLGLVDLAGPVGVYLQTALKLLFGSIRWIVPFLFLGISYMLWRPSRFELTWTEYVGFGLGVASLAALIHLVGFGDNLVGAAQQGLGGGYAALVLGWPLLRLLGFWAALLVALALFAIGGLLALNSRVESGAGGQRHFFSFWKNRIAERKIRRYQERKEKGVGASAKATLVADDDVAAELGFSAKKVERSAPASKSVQARQDEEVDGANDGPEPIEPNGLPGQIEPLEKSGPSKIVRRFSQAKIDIPFDLLDGRVGTPNGGDIKTNIMIIQRTFEEFGIQVEMGEAVVGPTVTQYTFKPAEGVKLSRVSGLQDNLALNLAAHPIRIEAPIPGRSLCGLEVPNQSTAIVPLRSALTSEEFKTRKSNMMVALGADVMGKPWFGDLPKMPHLLIAGSTGSGKSVCINTLILSLLFQNSPGQLKLILVDPKRVELPIYNGIPHLITPVITDVKKTVNALRWAVGEMERRFELLSAAHKRNIESYNAESGDPIPYIVIVIDELADLMAASAAEVEGAIIRLAQMSRAVGIHLVLATQRPSVDVITGLIKANITCRIAFAVASLVDSRTILDQAGAEKLLGRGDMLYVSAELGKPKRLQGCFASDSDIKRVIEHLRSKAEPEYVEEIVSVSSGSGADDASGDDGDEGDALLGEAKDVIFRARKASASLLQRRLRVGYARAARLLDLLERQGYIGPGDGAKPRDIIMSRFAGGGPAVAVTGPGDAEEAEDDLEDEAEQSESDALDEPEDEPESAVSESDIESADDVAFSESGELSADGSENENENATDTLAANEDAEDDRRPSDLA